MKFKFEGSCEGTFETDEEVRNFKEDFYKLLKSAGLVKSQFLFSVEIMRDEE